MLLVDRSSRTTNSRSMLYSHGHVQRTIPAASAVVYGRHDTWEVGAHPAPHNAPGRQWLVLLRGAVEVEVTDGSRRTFGAGDLLRAEDMDGAGHVTRPVDLPIEGFFLPG
jgi:hypothetical protein